MKILIPLLIAGFVSCADTLIVYFTSVGIQNESTATIHLVDLKYTSSSTIVQSFNADIPAGSGYFWSVDGDLLGASYSLTYFYIDAPSTTYTKIVYLPYTYNDIIIKLP